MRKFEQNFVLQLFYVLVLTYSFIKVVLTGSRNDDTGFTVEKPLFIGDKGTVPMVALTFLLAIYTKLLHRELEAAACSEDSIELLPQKSGTLLGK